MAPASGTPRAHTCQFSDSQVIFRHGVCRMAQHVMYRSSALAALFCPLLVTSRARSNVIPRAASVPAPQMLREGKFKDISLASQAAPNKACTRRWGVCAFFRRFLCLSVFLFGRRSAVRPSASNADRWVLRSITLL